MKNNCGKRNIYEVEQIYVVKDPRDHELQKVLAVKFEIINSTFSEKNNTASYFALRSAPASSLTTTNEDFGLAQAGESKREKDICFAKINSEVNDLQSSQRRESLASETISG